VCLYVCVCQKEIKYVCGCEREIKSVRER
jgi:hypothetical protein